MELWIRSQDRERLGKIILIEYCKDDYGYYLFGWRDKYEGSRLATYKSKERALEVLDEIQQILVPKFKLIKGKIEGSFDGTIFKSLDKCEIQQMSCYVYEMPKE